MLRSLESLIARFWNGSVTRKKQRAKHQGLDLGARLVDGEANGHVTIPHEKRMEHLAILGRTGTGKSSLLKQMGRCDIEALLGFVNFDFHGDTTNFLLGAIADEEKRLGRDLSDRLIVIDPSDPQWAVGMNPLEGKRGGNRFVQIAEFAAVLRERWQLDTFGARTDELLRNTLYVLADAGLTLLELAPLLTHAGFRARCLKHLENPEVRQYFELRYDSQSDAMKATMAEPILNKTSAFTADPCFRHIVGQRSTFSILDAMDEGRWVLVNLHKGRLGEQAATLGSLFFTAATNALFARRKRDLFTLYCDEVQNLVANGSRIDTVLSEARKFGVSVCSANQFLDQYPADVRAAILSIGTHIFFQLSPADAQQIANALDGGKQLAETLKNLPRRHFVLKSGHLPSVEGVAPKLWMPKADPQDLYNRSMARWARKRSDIEEDIRKRQGLATRTTGEALDDWQ